MHFSSAESEAGKEKNKFLAVEESPWSFHDENVKLKLN